MDEIQSKKEGPLGLITLNRPQKLNSLNRAMIDSLMSVLTEWESDDDIEYVSLEGAGKAFCAGGDVVSLIQAYQKGDKQAADFFAREYAVDLKIARYQKPLVAWSHGATMGGGLGLFQGASHRVVCDTSVLAMPEITIGFFPDVGATSFLNQLPGAWGFLMGMTGFRLSGGMAQILGFAETLLSKEKWEDCRAQLRKHPHELAQILSESCKEPSQQDREAVEQINELLRPFSPWPGLTSFDDFIRTHADHPLLKQAAHQYLHGSPTSIAVIERQLLRGLGMPLEEAYEHEARMAQKFMDHHDFFEGVRALLIDKDQKPEWQPASLSEIDHDYLQGHF